MQARRLIHHGKRLYAIHPQRHSFRGDGIRIKQSHSNIAVGTHSFSHLETIGSLPVRRSPYDIGRNHSAAVLESHDGSSVLCSGYVNMAFISGMIDGFIY